MKLVHKKIRVKGIVQGVGFRPFVYRLAEECNIFGYVLNDTEGVLIEAEGRERDMANFLAYIGTKAPDLAYIIDMDISEGSLAGCREFSIRRSTEAGERQAFFSPDIALCPDCLAEFRDPTDRRYHYPFITCINCGPRFGIVRDIPYDREKTSMKEFPLCPECAKEYESPGDRRFHAQPTACPACGPVLALYSAEGEKISDDTERVAAEAFRLIKQGSIIAVKGIGGYLLVCGAGSDFAVEKLRVRKWRPFKAFACMAASLEKVRLIAEVSPKEAELLTSKERPIVLLKMKKPYDGAISPLVAPGLSYIGIMLPYMPFQHMLFDKEPDLLLVMTSGNLAEEPIIYEDGAAFKSFLGIADYIITYNREITSQSDDSVVFAEGDSVRFIRRSRGFVPRPMLTTPADECIFAAGGDLKNAFAISKADFTIVSQHLGDMAHPKTQETFSKTLDRYIHIFNAKPDVIVSDMHPNYITAACCDELAANGEIRLYVQHHHAHIAAVMEEYGLEGKVLGIAFDGTGYGTDGTLWGSEFLVADKASFVRAGRFSGFLLPGGENAIRDVWKIGLSLLFNAFGKNLPHSAFAEEPERDALMEIMEKRINCPETCSMGRLFDGISAILGLCRTVSAEAEAAMLLEEAALRGSWKEEPFIVHAGENGAIPVWKLVRYVAELMEAGCSPEDCAAAFHSSLCHTALAEAERIRKGFGVNRAVLGGGCFHNRILLAGVSRLLKEAGFELFISEKLPINDGCISFGQTAVAKEMLKARKCTKSIKDP